MGINKHLRIAALQQLSSLITCINCDCASVVLMKVEKIVIVGKAERLKIKSRDPD
jgi:hypothetical protein